MILKQNYCITISITSSVVKVAQVAKGGVVEKLVKVDIQDGPDAAIRQALEGLKVKSADIICTISGDVATTKNIEVPSTNPEEIESILALQATRHTPFSKDEILTSYIKLPSPKPSFTNVLLVVVKREAVQEQLGLIKAAGIKVENVSFVPEAVAHFYAKAIAAKKGSAPIALIDISAESTDFLISAQGVLLMSRNLPIGLDMLSHDPEASKQLIDEIKASLEVYEHEGIAARPCRFCLTMTHATLAGFETALGEAIGSMVEVLPYTDLFKAAKSVKEAIAADFVNESALDVIAVGLEATKCDANLVSQEVKDQRVIAEKGKKTLKSGILILVCLFFLAGGLLSRVYFKDQFLKRNLIKQYSDQRAEVRDLEKIIKRSRLIFNYVQERSIPLEAIKELHQLVPQAIYFTVISIDSEGMLSVQGISDSMSKVFAFVTDLEEAELFEGVKTKSTSAKKVEGKDVAAFEITMKLVSGLAVVASK